jgi:hypothetical protein
MFSAARTRSGTITDSRRSPRSPPQKGSGAKAPYPDTLNLDALDPHRARSHRFIKQVRDIGLTPSAQQPLFLWHTNAAPGRPAPKTIVVQFHALRRRARHRGRSAHPRGALASCRTLKHEPRSASTPWATKRRAAASRASSPDSSARTARPFLPTASPARAPMYSKLPRSSSLRRTGMRDSLAHRPPLRSEPQALRSGARIPRSDRHALRARARHPLARQRLERDLLRAHGRRSTLRLGLALHELTKPFFKGDFPPSARRAHHARGPLRDPCREGEAQSALRIRAHRRRGQAREHEDGRRAPPCAHPAHAGHRHRVPDRADALADTINAPYLLIMGRKEALERNVILRERSTHTETFIPLDSLVDPSEGSSPTRPPCPIGRGRAIVLLHDKRYTR